MTREAYILADRRNAGKSTGAPLPRGVIMQNKPNLWPGWPETEVRHAKQTQFPWPVSRKRRA